MRADQEYDVVGLPIVVSAIDASDPRLGATRLVCVDGPAGSGKTTLAAALSTAVGDGVRVVHMDDLYRGWDTDFDETKARIWQQLLEPLSQGRPGRFQRYDWYAERFAEWIDVPVPTVLILEGVASGARLWAEQTSLLIWIDADRDVRLRRGVDRDGEALRPQWVAWMAHEEREHAREHTREQADLRLLGDVAGLDPSREVAVLRDR